MKVFFTSVFIILFLNILNAQYDSTYSTRFYEQRISFFEIMPNTANEIVMLGNSLTNGISWSEMFQDINIKNRGVSGDNTFGILARLDEVISSKPRKIFILIGVNDIANNTPIEIITRNYEKIVSEIKNKSPETKLYLHAIFPVNDDFPHFKKIKNKEDQINQLNKNIYSIADKYKTTFIDMTFALSDENGKLDKRFTNDGLHLLGNAYILWANTLRKHIYE